MESYASTLLVSTYVMSIFHGASHVAILGGTQIAAGAGSTVAINLGMQGGVSSAFKDLSAAAAHTALHDSAARFDAPRCHRNTRTKYLKILKLWMLGKGCHYYGKRLIWLHGGVGAGKSAIMQSLVEWCTRQAVILGTFFFFRADTSRNSAEVLIPTLAFQVARVFPAAMTILEPSINHNPLIFQASLHTQAYELLVRPLLHLVEAGVIGNTGPLHNVFVIDGLDECRDPQKQALIINVIASILCDYDVPVSFLISSRPEVTISSAFERESRVHGIYASIYLNDDDEAECDIRQYIEDSFDDIIRLHPLRSHIPLDWPNAWSIDRLVRKSSGHFVYAATVMKFISSTSESPPRALQVVEGLKPSRTESPFVQLDALYLHILTSARYGSHVLGILRHCCLTSFEPSVAAVCCIYQISPEDVELFLSDVQSLVSLSPNGIAGMDISLKHASLGDFLSNKTRSQALYIAREDYHAFFLERYFQLLDIGPQVPTSSFFSWQYGASSLIHSLAEAIVGSRDTDLLQSLIKGHCPQDIWNICVESCALDTEISTNQVRDLTTQSVCEYMRAIRDSILNHDNTLYIHQFKMYIELVLDDMNDFVRQKPQYRMIPALMFSSNASGLFLAHRLLDDWGCQFLIDASYQHHFGDHLRIYTEAEGEIIDPRSLEAIRRSPQSRLYWGSDLAIAMKLILRQLVDLSWAPEWLYSNPRGGWFRRNKPLKQRLLYTPKLTSNFSSHLRNFKNPHFTDLEVWRCLERNGFSPDHIFKIVRARSRCLILLKAVIHYLHKSECTSEVVKLARRSLPKAALMFPKAMKTVRAEMDAFVRRWEESPDGLFEKAQLMPINNID